MWSAPWLCRTTWQTRAVIDGKIVPRKLAHSTVLVFIEAWLADAAPFGRVVAWFGAEAFDLFVLRAHITISVGVALAVIARPVSGARDCLSTVFKLGLPITRTWMVVAT